MEILKTLPGMSFSMVCPSSFWVSVISFSEKKSKVWEKINFFGTNDDIAVNNGILKEQNVSFGI